MRTYRAEDYLRPGLDVHIFKGDESCSFSHLHNFLEIVYIMDGSCTEYINSAKYHVKRGNMLFINYNSTHSFTIDKNLVYVNIILKPETMGKAIINPQNAFGLLSLTAFDELNECESDGCVVSFKGSEQEEIESILNNMLNEIKLQQPAYEQVLNNYTNIVITKLLRKMYLASQEYHDKDVWDELTDYIDNHINDKLNLDELAKKCFYNPSYFSRVFKEKFGITLVEYIHKKRCLVATGLLTKTELTTGEIADRCGFGSKTAFYRSFQKIHGCTPSEYRKK